MKALLATLIVVACACFPLAAQAGNNQDNNDQRAADQAWSKVIHKGVILKVTKYSLTCEDINGKKFTARVDDKTTYVCKGKAITMGDLSPRLFVIITPASSEGLIKKLEVVEKAEDLKNAPDSPAATKKK